MFIKERLLQLGYRRIHQRLQRVEVFLADQPMRKGMSCHVSVWPSGA